ncbi:hypothetical protein PR048_031370 [Dryococelus australis]|uniref:Uncharacterized protein n=1 Tax=Dryococelus australis TaxID=614101 RepID=A0ABQ9G856_9NEOP|nr:hypothetical protein PR048_031370 [Dryococelus australis]
MTSSIDQRHVWHAPRTTLAYGKASTVERPISSKAITQVNDAEANKITNCSQAVPERHNAEVYESPGFGGAPGRQLSTLLIIGDHKFRLGSRVRNKMSLPSRTGFDSRRDRPWSFARANRAGRCRWSAGFLGDLPFPPPLHSSAAPHREKVFVESNKICLVQPNCLCMCNEILSGPNIFILHVHHAHVFRGKPTFRGLEWVEKVRSPGARSRTGKLKRAPVASGDPGYHEPGAGRTTFITSRLHSGYWFLLRAPSVYSTEQAPVFLATFHHTPLHRGVQNSRYYSVPRETCLHFNYLRKIRGSIGYWQLHGVIFLCDRFNRDWLLNRRAFMIGSKRPWDELHKLSANVNSNKNIQYRGVPPVALRHFFLARRTVSNFRLGTMPHGARVTRAKRVQMVFARYSLRCCLLRLLFSPYHVEPPSLRPHPPAHSYSRKHLNSRSASGEITRLDHRVPWLVNFKVTVRARKGIFFSRQLLPWRESGAEMKDKDRASSGKKLLPAASRAAPLSGALPTTLLQPPYRILYPLNYCGPTIGFSTHCATVAPLFGSLPTALLRSHYRVVYPLSYCGSTIGFSTHFATAAPLSGSLPTELLRLLGRNFARLQEIKTTKYAKAKLSLELLYSGFKIARWPSYVAGLYGPKAGTLSTLQQSLIYYVVRGPRWRRIDFSLLTKANWVQFPAGSLPDFHLWESCPDDAVGRRMFSGVSRFPRPCIPPLLQSHLTPPSSALKISILRAAQISPLHAQTLRDVMLACTFYRYEHAILAGIFKCISSFRTLSRTHIRRSHLAGTGYSWSCFHAAWRAGVLPPARLTRRYSSARQRETTKGRVTAPLNENRERERE